MRKIAHVIILALLLAVPTAEAGPIPLSWTPPTHNTDGTLYTDGDGYVIYVATTDGGPYTEIARVSDPAAVSYIVESLAPGVYYFVATAINTDSTESAYSNQVMKVSAEVAPEPPVLTVQDMTVFIIVKTRDQFLLVPTGTVPAGTPCDPTQSVNGHYAVPTSEVTWTGVEGVVAVAKCG